MGTPLATGSKSKAPPALKLQNVGDEVKKFAVVDIKLDLPMTEYGTDKPKLNSRGNQKTQHALTVLVLEVGEAVVHVGDRKYESAAVNELHTIYIDSYAKYDPDRDPETAPYKSWGGITDEVGLEVGFIGTWKFLAEVPGQGSEPRKDRKFRLRAPTAEEAAIVERCEALHAELRERGTELPTHDDHGEEEPF